MVRRQWFRKAVAYLTVLVGSCALLVPEPVKADESVKANATRVSKGIIAVFGWPEQGRPASVVDLAEGGERLVYFQSPDPERVSAVRKAADSAGLLGQSVFVEQGALRAIHLAGNIADEVLVSSSVQDRVPREEILRVLHPGAVATVAGSKIVKPAASGVDGWTHPYHGPDNNPQSTDQLARAPYRTQFLAGPLFSPMPEVTVAANGRIFKAFGHIAHKANQNAVLNTLMCINAYNGSELWRRDLRSGFMIHRNTLVATPDALFIADDQSCKIIDAASGRIRDEIIVPDGLADGAVWKWMALKDNVLYALIGGDEVTVDTMKSRNPGLGHWPWGMWKGHDYGEPGTSFGFGRTFLAIDPETKKVLWKYQDDQHLDSRGVCMGNGKIYFYCPEKFLGCLNAEDGTLAWKNSDDDLLQAIGPNERAQHYVTGYATTTYIKCNDKQLFFAGPQRQRFVVASTEDGRFLWDKEIGNLQIVLRDDGIYCAGPQMKAPGAGAKYSYDGQRLASLPVRRACTRATGSIDSVFYRTSGGTVRVNTASNSAEHIAPMRPPCQDGVIISDGLLFWGPWMCGCQLSLYGHICLTAAEHSGSDNPYDPQFQRGDGDPSQVASFDLVRGDWPTFQRDSWRSGFTPVKAPNNIQPLWRYRQSTDDLPTAPVVAGGVTFIADRTGVVRALDAQGQSIWSMHTGGPVYYPPTLAQGRLFVGSADGRVYALEAKTGRMLWSYRVAPEARWIPVYGKLMSTWPVAGGVVEQDGVIYAAAGIAHYDGTHVVALDAVTGDVVWKNDSSGELAEDVNCGISLQGELQVRGDELQFQGGGAYQFARYDRRTGKCLNEPRRVVTSQFQTAFYPYFPAYGNSSSLHHTFPDGRTLAYAYNYNFDRAVSLRILEPAKPASKASGQAKPARKTDRRRDAAGQPQRRPVWQLNQLKLITSFVVTPETLIAGGTDNPDNIVAKIVAIDMATGKIKWQRKLAALPVKGGIAMDHEQRLVVALENGDIHCFGPTDN